MAHLSADSIRCESHLCVCGVGAVTGHLAVLLSVIRESRQLCSAELGAACMRIHALIETDDS